MQDAVQGPIKNGVMKDAEIDTSSGVSWHLTDRLGKRGGQVQRENESRSITLTVPLRLYPR